jgi:uncharacterized membrane protein YgdD (TMEM256/DUF423 family)
MHKSYLVAAVFFGFLSVGLGAFGAHGLEKITADEKILHSFQTGVQYQMYHALALLAVAIIYDKISNPWMKWAGILFVTGIILFSGSLYLLTALNISGSSMVRIVGPITPVGGIFLMTGWLCFLAGVVRKK